MGAGNLVLHVSTLQMFVRSQAEFGGITASVAQTNKSWGHNNYGVYINALIAGIETCDVMQ